MPWGLPGVQVCYLSKVDMRWKQKGSSFVVGSVLVWVVTMADLGEGPRGPGSPPLFWLKKKKKKKKEKRRIAEGRKADRASDKKTAPHLSSRSGSAIGWFGVLSSITRFFVILGSISFQMTSYWKSYHRRVIRMLFSLTCKSVLMPFQSKFLYFLAFNYQYIIKEVERKIPLTLYVFPIYSTFLRLEFGSAAQPPPTPSAAEKPVTPTGERRKFYYVIVIGLCEEQFRE